MVLIPQENEKVSTFLLSQDFFCKAKAVIYLFLSRDRCVRVALGRAEFTAAAALQIRLGGGSGSTSVTAVTCLVRVF